MGGHSDSEWKDLGDGSLITEDAEKGLGHIVPRKVYNRTFACLLILTVITVWAASLDFGVLALAVAIAIATIKAGLVTLFFMHLNWENKIIWGIVIYPLFIFGLIVGATLGDEMIKDHPVPLADPFGLSDNEIPRPAPTAHH